MILLRAEAWRQIWSYLEMLTMMIAQSITQLASFLYKRGPIYYFRRHVPTHLRYSVWP